jgi:hypothetical protein
MFANIKCLFLGVLFALPPAATFAMPSQVIIIRHAEKPAKGNQLCAAGYQHAAELVSYFQTNKDVTEYGTPEAIYAMAPSSSDGTLRPIETVTPLATALGQPVLHPYSRKQLAPLVNAIMTNPAYSGKMVLVCWEHTVIPELIAQFGVGSPLGPWADSDFTSVYRIDFLSNGQVSGFTHFQQDIAAPTAPCH